MPPTLFVILIREAAMSYTDTHVDRADIHVPHRTGRICCKGRGSPRWPPGMSGEPSSDSLGGHDGRSGVL